MSKFNRGHTAAAKLTPQQVLEIRRRWALKLMSQADMAREFQISSIQIGRICRGEAWQEYSHAVEPGIDEIQRSLARLDMIMPVEGAEADIDPELKAKIEKELELMRTTDPTPAVSNAVDEVLKERARRLGGQPNDQGINEATGGVRTPIEPPTTERSIHGGSSNPVGTGPLPEAGGDTDKTGEDA